MKRPIIGIIGGMGPEATLELFRLMLAATPVQRDQDHHHIIIDNYSQIPDRTAAILGKGPDPLPALAESARRLEQAGAAFLTMPCNTAHNWLEPLGEQVGIPVLDMITTTAETVACHTPAIQTLGLLATRGTVQVGLYQRALADQGLAVQVPEDDDIAVVMEVIYGIKAGDYSGKPALLAVAQRLLARGAQGLILGCTELPLMLGRDDLKCQLFNPLEVLARQAVAYADGKHGMS